MRYVGMTVVLALSLNASSGSEGLNLSLGDAAVQREGGQRKTFPVFDGTKRVVSLESRENFRIRDPFILVDGGRYWLYETKPWSGGEGVEVRVSDDLENWSAPAPALRLPEGLRSRVTAYWAPEVHRHDGAYYLFVSLTEKPFRRGTWIFKSDRPEGPFAPVADRSATPEGWSCIDGTLFIEKGCPYLVFCREWTEVGDGQMLAMKMKCDLSGPVDDPVLLFKATDYKRNLSPQDGLAAHVDHVTDGPFLFRTPKRGRLQMIWSNVVRDRGYVALICESETGSVLGPWVNHRFLFDRDGGHGMVFRTLDGRLMLTLHQPNHSPDERMKFFELDADGNLKP